MLKCTLFIPVHPQPSSPLRNSVRQFPQLKNPLLEEANVGGGCSLSCGDPNCSEGGVGRGAAGGGGTPMHSGQLPTVAEVRSPGVLHSLSNPVRVRSSWS